MAVLHKPSQHAFFTKGETLTEPEHQPMTDATKLLQAAARGAMINGRSAPVTYGYDDTTLDPISFRQQKEELEKELTRISIQEEIEEEALKHIPQTVKEKLKFKVKRKTSTPAIPKDPELSRDSKNKNDDSNDDKKTPNPDHHQDSKS